MIHNIWKWLGNNFSSVIEILVSIGLLGWVMQLIKFSFQARRVRKKASNMVAFISTFPRKDSDYFFISDWDKCEREIDGKRWIPYYEEKNLYCLKRECDFLVKERLLEEMDAPIQVNQGSKYGYFITEKLFSIAKCKK